MNVEAAFRRPKPVKLTATDFWLLRHAGAFAAYSKSELLDGELWGVFVQDEDEPESDAEFPIKLRIEDYLRLDEAGAFERYPKTELLDGLVYAMNPQHRPHMFAKSELAYRLRRALEEIGSALFVGTEGSVALSEVDLPMPDILLTSEPRGTGPVPEASVRLLVEVSDSSIAYDLSFKSSLFASRGITEYWVVDLNGAVIHQMWQPRADAYAERQEVPFGQPIRAVTIENLTIETAGLS